MLPRQRLGRPEADDDFVEVIILVSLKDLGTKLCSYNQKDVGSVHCIKVYLKELLKNNFVFVET